MKKAILTLVLMMAAVLGETAAAQNVVIRDIAELKNMSAIMIPNSMISSALKGKVGELGDSTLQRVQSVYVLNTEKSGTVKKARKMLKNVTRDKSYEMMFVQKHDKECVAIYGTPAGSETLNEIIVVNDEDKRGMQIIDITGTLNKKDVFKLATGGISF